MRLKEKGLLIAEDDEAEITLINVVLRKCGITDRVAIVREGEEALDYLCRRGKYKSSSPFSVGLILLDLKLPKISGLEILKIIRADKRLRSIPVVIFTSSCSDLERRECLASGANDCMTKPIEFNEFSDSIQRVVKEYLLSSAAD